ncbi:hypothetical protein HMPREF0262_03044 [Clostridium sp. ATCC 29733]|nr:hypothetical protein HMPREF0262_03044 [Clostridium sp. ATCC 29733]
MRICPWWCSSFSLSIVSIIAPTAGPGGRGGRQKSTGRYGELAKAPRRE